MEKKAAITLALFERTPAWASRLFPQTIWSLRERRHEIFLTFDDGPQPEFTASLLELLAANHARATFFLVGEKAHAYPLLVREIAAAGHAIGNHTMHHRQLRWQRRTIVHEEITLAQEVIEDCAGIPVRHFRPPYGTLRPAIFEAVKNLNLNLTMWSLMPGDVWRVNHPKAIADSITKQARGGDVILLHDGHDCASATIAALRESLPRLKEKGFHFSAMPNRPAKS